MYAFNAPIETVIFLFEPKLGPKRQWTARLALVFLQKLSNESHSGSEIFHCPFGSKMLEKAKMNIFAGLKNGSCPHQFNKHG